MMSNCLIGSELDVEIEMGLPPLYMHLHGGPVCGPKAGCEPLHLLIGPGPKTELRSFAASKGVTPDEALKSIGPRASQSGRH
jgi:hypothetical protein